MLEDIVNTPLLIRLHSLLPVYLESSIDKAMNFFQAINERLETQTCPYSYYVSSSFHSIL